MEHKWSTMLLGDIAAELTVGHVGPMANEYVGSGVAFLRSQNVEPFRINLDDVKYIPSAFHRPLRERWEELKTALGPFRELPLVSRGKLKDFTGKTGVYNVRLLMGAGEHFDIAEVRVPGKLEEHWAYLLGTRADEPPIALAPLLRVRLNSEIGRHELMMPRTLVLEPGQKVELWQLTGAQTEKVQVP